MSYAVTRRTSAKGAAGALLAVALLVGGCGDGEPASGPGPGPVVTSVATSPAVTAEGPAVTDYLDYVGGRAGAADPDLAPIPIGWVNGQGGRLSYPAATEGAQAAVKYVNAELGGVGGHPLELRTCFIAQAEEEGQRCGQRLLNDEKVSVIAYGAVPLGSQALTAVVDGRKPIVVGVSSAPSDSTAKNAYLLHGDQEHVLAGWGTFARDVLKAKTAALVYPSQAGANSAAAAVRKGLEDAGLTVTAVGFDGQATDLLGPLTAAGAQTADVIVPVTDAPPCVNIAKALAGIGSTTPVLSGPLCLSPEVSEGLGDLPVNWIFGAAQVLPADASAPDIKAYTDAATRHGLARPSAADPFAALGWGEILAVTRLMNRLGADKITPEAMTAALKDFTGPLVMGPPTVRCGADPDAPAVCGDQARFYKYLGKGRFEPVSGWLGPPK